MAGWIGSTDAQRYWGYTVPHHRNQLRSKGYEKSLAKREAGGKAFAAELAKQTPGTVQYRMWERRLKAARKGYAGTLAAFRHSKALVAAADQGKIYKGTTQQ